MGDDNDSSIASLSAILDESLLDASTSEATGVQSRKGTKSTDKTTRKGKTSAEKRTNKEGGEKLSNAQSPPKDGEAGKVPQRTTDSHASKVAEYMADIKQQVKDLTGSLALITPVVTEIKSAYSVKARVKKLVMLMDKFPTPGNCNRLEAVRVNPEIFNSVRKEVKSEDVMLQKAQKPLLKDITAVTRILDDFMKVEKGNKPLPSTESVMKILSDSISLLSDASHETDIRRRTLFKGDIKNRIQNAL